MVTDRPDGLSGRIKGRTDQRHPHSCTRGRQKLKRERRTYYAILMEASPVSQLDPSRVGSMGVGNQVLGNQASSIKSLPPSPVGSNVRRAVASRPGTVIESE